MTEENPCHHLKPLLRIQPGHQPPPPSPLTNGLGGHNTRQSVPALMTSPKGLIVTLPFPFLAPSQDVSHLLEAALPSVSKSLPFPQRLFWEPARITGGTARRTGRHCPLAPPEVGGDCGGGQSAEERDASEVGRGHRPGFLWPETGAGAGDLGVVWLGRPGRVGTNHTLALCAEEETLPQTDSPPVFLDKCVQKGSFQPRFGARVLGWVAREVAEGQRPRAGNLWGEGRD